MCSPFLKYIPECSHSWKFTCISPFLSIPHPQQHTNTFVSNLILFPCLSPALHQPYACTLPLSFLLEKTTWYTNQSHFKVIITSLKRFLNVPGVHPVFPSSIVSAEWPFHIFSHLNPTVLPDDPVSHLTENIVTTEREHLPRTRPIDLASLLITTEELSPL